MTLKAEEFDTLKACINVDHIEKNIRDRPWWTQIGTHFDKQFYKGIEGHEWEEVYRGTVCVYARRLQGSIGRTASSFSSSKKKEQVVASNEVLPNHYVSAETLEACALIGLHLLAADCEVGSNGSQSPDIGDMCKYGCPKRSIWSSPCSASATSGDDEEYWDNNECRATEVIGQD